MLEREVSNLSANWLEVIPLGIEAKSDRVTLIAVLVARASRGFKSL